MKGYFRIIVTKDTHDRGRSHRDNIYSKRATSSYKGGLSCNS